MLGKLALQRTNVRFTHLTALAVMAALVVGLFGLMGSASAGDLIICSWLTLLVQTEHDIVTATAQRHWHYGCMSLDDDDGTAYDVTYVVSTSAV